MDAEVCEYSKVKTRSFVPTVTEFPRMSHVADTPSEALEGMIELVQFVLEDMHLNGEVIPAPIAQKKYAGKISLRMTPEQHRRIAMEAAEQGISINQLLVSRI